MTSTDAFIGIDLGTQGARAMAVAGDGTVLGHGTAPLAGRRRAPRHEQDPEQWWPAVAAACSAATANVGPGAIKGVAVCSTSATVVLLNAMGKPLAPAVMYDDARATSQAQRAQRSGAALWASLGYRMQPTWGLPKLLWLLEHHGRPAGARLAHQADMVVARLIADRPPTDSSHALKSGYDLLRNCWPVEIMAALDVPGDTLPDVVPPGTAIGSVCARAAGATGIPQGTTVFAGMTDGCAAQLAAGATDLGNWNSTLGTTLVLKGVSERPLQDPAGLIYSHRSPDGLWLPGAASGVGAGVLTKSFSDQDLDRLSAAAASREPATAVAYPLVSPGERFPFVEPRAEAFLLGEPVDELDHFAALLQGVALVERLCFDYLDLVGAATDGDLTLTGGASRNRYWCGLRADVLNRPVKRPANGGSAAGMALLAAAAAQGVTLADAAKNMVTIHDEIEPRPDASRRWGDAYLSLVDELQRRGWLPASLADHARGAAHDR